jgi:hypothetical protein
MNHPNQMYLFNYMEYDDYESNDWEDILFSDNDFALETNTDDLSEIVNDESDIIFYDHLRDVQIQYENDLYAKEVSKTHDPFHFVS